MNEPTNLNIIWNLFGLDRPEIITIQNGGYLRNLEHENKYYACLLKKIDLSYMTLFKSWCAIKLFLFNMKSKGKKGVTRNKRKSRTTPLGNHQNARKERKQ